MRHWKQIENGYFVSVGTGGMGDEIPEAEYNAILSVIHDKPPRTDTTDYRLREDLTWEAYPIDPPDPDPEIDDAEVYNILFGGVV